MFLNTVKVRAENSRGYKIINRTSFNPDEHTIWTGDDTNEPVAPKAEPTAPTEPTAPAEPAEPAEPAAADAATEPTASDAVTIEQLRTEATELGIQFDGRTGLKKLAELIKAAKEDAQSSASNA